MIHKRCRKNLKFHCYEIAHYTVVKTMKSKLRYSYLPAEIHEIMMCIIPYDRSACAN